MAYWLGMAFLPLFLATPANETDVVLPKTDVYNRLTNQTVARREDDAFFVFDRFEQRILLFEPGKDQPKLVARKGKGPGELDRTNLIFIFNDRLYVLSAPNIQTFDLSGKFQQHIHFPPGVSVKKTTTGWLAAKWDAETDHLGLYLTNERLAEPEPVIRWNENIPYGQKAVPGKTMVVPVYMDMGGHAVSPDGDRIYYRLPSRPRIQIFSISENKIIGSILLKERFYFDKERGRAEIERLQEGLPRSKIVGKFPEYFPYTNGLHFDVDGYLIVRRFMGRKAKLFRYDPDGNPVAPPVLNLDEMKRVVGKQDDYFYVSFQNQDRGDMGIRKIPRKLVKAFIESNPID